MVAPGINGHNEQLNERLPYDPDASKKLLAEAGYPDGFEIGMDCPNDRYVNDEKICQAVVSMLAKVGIKVDLFAQPKSKYFKKVLSFDTTFYLLGWQPSTYDSLSPLFSVMSTPERYVEGQEGVLKGQGAYNPAGYSNPRIDELTRLVRDETDPVQRQKLIDEAFAIHKDEVGHFPIHQQALAWGVRDGLEVVQRADDFFVLRWTRIKR
jgi:peptide/nickel transport system substrate-binding protein